MRNKQGRFVKGYRSNIQGEFRKGNIPWNKKAKNPIVCLWCNKIFFVIDSRKNKAKFCSNKCRSKHTGKRYSNPFSFYKKNHNEYVYLHNWVYKTLGRANQCSFCGKSGRIHWANKTGRYLKQKSDWISLCSKCHSKYDIERGIRQFAQ